MHQYHALCSYWGHGQGFMLSMFCEQYYPFVSNIIRFGQCHDNFYRYGSVVHLMHLYTQ